MSTQEDRLNSLAAEQASLAAGQNALVGVVNDLSRKVEHLDKSIQNMVKPQWATVFAGCALVLAIGAQALAPVSRDVDGLEEHHEKLRDEFVAHTQNGHPDSVKELLNKHNDRLKYLEDRTHSRWTRDDHFRAYDPVLRRIEILEERIVSGQNTSVRE